MSLINNLNNTDFVIMFIILLFMFYGYKRGFIKELLSIFSLFLSCYVSINLYPSASQFLRNYIEIHILADSITFGVLFVFIYSVIAIFSSILIRSIRTTSINIFDKNFGIIFGFFKSMIILSLIFVVVTITIWKKNIPNFIIESKSIKIISYTSSLMINLIPINSLNKIKSTFNIEYINPVFFKNKDKSIEKYNEPELEPNLKKNKEGYTKNDNESLDRLFNIENSDE